MAVNVLYMLLFGLRLVPKETPTAIPTTKIINTASSIIFDFKD